MIAKRIDREPGHDNYRALALYAADASIGGAAGEKTFHSWYAGGETDDYVEGLIEVEATQALNRRSEEPKTYHLMVSFRPEDEPRLTRETLEEIETLLAEALGFSEHQRHCGVHSNTNNLHMHIAYNAVHPRKFTRHAPYYDFAKLSRACRMIEQKYGLAVDRGMEPDQPKTPGQPKAKVRTIEAQTGQESLFSYIMGHKVDLMSAVRAAQNWPEVHRAFLRYGLLLKPRGNGLIIKDRDGRHHAKPSDVDRELSKARLVDRLGPYAEFSPDLLKTTEAIHTYSARPLHQGAERDGLHQLYQSEIDRRREAIEAINQESSRRFDDCRRSWKEKKARLERLPMLKADRQRVKHELRKREKDDLDRLRAETRQKRDAVRQEIPFTSWNKLLQHRAALGDETALAILRSRKKTISPENTAWPDPSASPVRPEQDTRQRIVDDRGLSCRNRQALLAVVKMRELLEREGLGSQSDELKFTIDTKGTVIFTLPDGGRIRDSGRQIHFSTGKDKTRELALKFAQSRWGRGMALEGGAIKK